MSSSCSYALFEQKLALAKTKERLRATNEDLKYLVGKKEEDERNEAEERWYLSCVVCCLALPCVLCRVVLLFAVLFVSYCALLPRLGLLVASLSLDANSISS